MIVFASSLFSLSTVSLSMYCEITIQCKKDLPANLSIALEQRLGPSSDKRTAIDSTYWRGSYDLMDQVVYAFHSPNDKVFLIQNPELSSLKIHVESNKSKSDIEVLEEATEEVLRQVERFLRSHRNCCASAKALIYAEGDFLWKGKLTSMWDEFKNAIKDNVLLEIYVPASTFVASILLQYDSKQAAQNLLAVMIAASIWFLIQVMRFEKKIVYRED